MTATSGLGGLFLVSGLVPGYYFARTSNSQGFVDELYHEMPCPNWCTVSAGTPILVSAGAAAGSVDFTLQAAARLTGSVTDAAKGTPLAGVWVSVLTLTGGHLASGTTATDGSFAISLPFEGRYLVRADGTGLGYVSDLFDDVMCQPECDLSRATAVMLAFDAVRAGIDFALTPGWRIEGTVTDGTTSGPIAGVHVEVLTASGSVVTGSGTDAAGRYSVRGLSSGRYFVRTRDSAGYLDELYDDVPCSGGSCAVSSGTSVTVAAAGTTGGVDFALTAGGQVTGVVTAQDTGQPLVSANVSLYHGEGRYVRNVFTDPAGTYAFGGLSAGTYFVEVGNVAGDHIGELFDDRPCPNLSCSLLSGTPVPVPSGATRRVDVSLDPGGSITGA